MNPVIGFWQNDMGREPDVIGEAYLKLHPTSVSKARAYVREWIGADHLAHEDVRLVTSELVTNAILHSHRGRPRDLITLTLAQRADLLYVEVLDPGGGSWTPRDSETVPDDEECGRGLAIVAEISRRRWGVRDHGALGRTVWCAVDGGPAPLERPCG